MLLRKSMGAFVLMLCVLSTLFTSSGYAMQVERSFPAGVKLGKLSMTALADVVIDGKLVPMSVALRIYDEENRIVVPASLYVKNVPVYYVINEMGEVHRIWILTVEEVRRPLPRS